MLKMKKMTFVIMGIMAVVLLADCQLELTCNKPYIKVDTACCLDNDNNSICNI